MGTFSPQNREPLNRIYVLNINSNSKVWAFALEMASQKSAEGHQVLILDTSNVPSFGFNSLARKRFQKNTLNSELIVAIKKHFSLIEYLRENLFAYSKFIEGRKINRFPAINSAGIELTAIIYARISTFLGVRDYEFSEIPWRVFRKHFITATICSRFFKQNFPAEKSSVIAYNGREVMSAVLLQHAFANGCQTIIGERGSVSGKFQLFADSPHYHPNWWDLIKNYKEEYLQVSELQLNVSNYKRGRLSGFDTYFSDTWNPPKDLVEGKNLDLAGYVLYFTSSSTEFSPFEKFDSKLGYANQFEGVDILASECHKQGQTLVIRRHPKSIGIDDVDREEKFWEQVRSYPNVRYIGPKEDYSSYKLAEDAAVIFAWRSSMGYESMLMDKPTYALGTSKWAWDPQIQCWSREQIEKAIRSPKLEPASANIIEKFSQFMSSSGTKYNLFKSVEKWGVITISDTKIFNLFLQRARSKTYDYYLTISNKSRKRNA